MNSGRGRAYLGKANPPRPGTVPVVKAPAGLKRTNSLNRTTGLKQSPDGLKRGSEPKASRGRRVKPGGPDAGAEWRAAALELFGAFDMVTGEALRPRWQCHHAVTADCLWAMRMALPLVPLYDDNGEVVSEHPGVWHPWNAMPLNYETHVRHDDGTPWTIPASALRPQHWAFARLVQSLSASTAQWAEVRLEAYPSSPTTNTRS